MSSGIASETPSNELLTDRYTRLLKSYRLLFPSANKRMSEGSKPELCLKPASASVVWDVETQTLNVDPEKIQADPEQTHVLMAQELFRGLVAQGPDWWQALGSHWAGHRYGGPSQSHHPSAVVQACPYVLSLPIRNCGQGGGQDPTELYTLLLDYLEARQPGCVQEALGRADLDPWRWLLDTVGKTGLYGDFVQEILQQSLPLPGLWTHGRIVETPVQTQLFRVWEPGLGQSDALPRKAKGDWVWDNPESFMDPLYRDVPHRFSNRLAPLTPMEPLTARFFRVVANGLPKTRKLTVWARGFITQDPKDAGKLMNTAWLMTLGPTQGRHTFRLGEGGSILHGLGQDFRELWIGLFNPFPESLDYDLWIRLESPDAQEQGFQLQGPLYKVRLEQSMEWREGQEGQTPSSQWRLQSESLDFQSRWDGTRIRASWTQPPSSLKQGEAFDWNLQLEVEGPRAASMRIHLSQAEEWTVDGREADAAGITLSLPEGSGLRKLQRTLRLELSGRPESQHPLTGAPSSKRKPIETRNLELSLEAAGCGRVEWLYSR